MPENRHRFDCYTFALLKTWFERQCPVGAGERKMKTGKALLVCLLLLGPVLGAQAECTAKKAAKNAALDATVGVSGRCDSDKLVGDAKDDASDKLDIDKKKDRGKDKKADRDQKLLDRDKD